MPTEWVAMNIKCPLCYQNDCAIVSSYKSDSSAFNSADKIVECNHCKLAFAFPIPSEKDLKAYYSNGYYSLDKETFSKNFQNFAIKLNTSRIKLLRTHIKHQNFKKCLDVRF